MNIFSLAHLNHLVRQLPDPETTVDRVIRIPIDEWDPIDDKDHPAGEFEAHAKPYVEFELIQWKNIKGISSPRWVLRGLVAM
jgi:hypothetical protein